MRKKWFSGLMALLLAAGVIFSGNLQTVQAATYKSGTYKVFASSLNVRSEASKSSASLGSLKKGKTVSVSKVENSVWGQISFGGNTGWIHLSYCDKVSTSDAGSSDSSGSSGSSSGSTGGSSSVSSGPKGLGSYVADTSLYIRETDSASSASLGVLSKGKTVTVTELKRHWGKITYRGVTGYVYLDYCHLASEGSSSGGSSDSGSSSSGGSSGGSSSGDDAGTYTVTATSLRVRKSASTSSTTVASLRDGDVVKVSSVSNGWGKVTVGGKTGYISMDYVKKGTGSGSSSGDSSGSSASGGSGSGSSKYSTGTYIVTASTLKVRADAGTSYKMVTTCRKGKTLSVTAVANGEWGKVKVSGKTGYVCLRYCKKK